MDNETRQRFERIEAILGRTAEQQERNTQAITDLGQKLDVEIQLWRKMRQALARQKH